VTDGLELNYSRPICTLSEGPRGFELGSASTVASELTNLSPTPYNFSY
jgi:hypothetical protein